MTLFERRKVDLARRLIPDARLEVFDVSHNPGLSGVIPEQIIVDWAAPCALKCVGIPTQRCVVVLSFCHCFCRGFLLSSRLHLLVQSCNNSMVLPFALHT